MPTASGLLVAKHVMYLWENMHLSGWFQFLEASHGVEPGEAKKKENLKLATLITAIEGTWCWLNVYTYSLWP